MNPTQPKVSAIVCAQNEAATIGGLLKQIRQIPEWKETIVVVNGSSDQTAQIASAESGTRVVSYKQALGHDVGRAIGASVATGEILLFIDGDMIIPAEELYPFICEVAAGVDLALNNLMPLLPPFNQWDSVSLVKAFLNAAANRDDLRANSMTAVPHAISRRAIAKFGVAPLCVPPLMQVKLMLDPTMRIRAKATVDVIHRNRMRVDNVGPQNRVGEMIIGDHMEALHELLRLKGSRGLFLDHNRMRAAFTRFLAR
jgi:glycosyltransferase involved in cell wall biosynthesis